MYGYNIGRNWGNRPRIERGNKSKARNTLEMSINFIFPPAKFGGDGSVSRSEFRSKRAQKLRTLLQGQIAFNRRKNH
jgi:hypothetical protein